MELKSIMLCYANSLQSCPTLCDPVDGSLPASPVPGILEARTLEWVAISFSSAWKWKVKVKSLSRVQLLESIITEIKNSLQGFSSTFRQTKGSVNMKISQFSSVQFSHSVVSDSLRPHELQHARPPCPSPIPRVYRTRVHRVGDASSHLILCRPLLLLPPILPSIRIFSNESTLHMRWPKYWSFSFSIIPSKEHPGLISIRMDWLYPLAVQGSLKSLL